MNNGQARILEKIKYRYCTQNRRIGAGTVKKKQRHRNETILQLREKGITNYEAQIGVLALAPQKKYDSICLLYTSPSPRDLSTSRMPSSA